MHNREDETIALDAKCPNTPDMFMPLIHAAAVKAGEELADMAMQSPFKWLGDKCISDDFPKPEISQGQIDAINSQVDNQIFKALANGTLFAADKSITDDFPKQIDQRNHPED